MKKKLAILAAAGLTLVSAAAYAQMSHQGSTMKAQGDMTGPGMMQQMHGMMHGGGMQGHMQGMRHGGGAEHGAATQPKGDTSPSSLAFNGINSKMHESMNITFTGNADVDFVKGMIPHHQGAIDMAKTVMAFGKNPEIRKLAEDIVRAQESEIAMMKAWLEKSAR
jgi:uncharacterized protein (DUF305 family)